MNSKKVFLFGLLAIALILIGKNGGVSGAIGAYLLVITYHIEMHE